MHWFLICNSEAKCKEAGQNWLVLTPVCRAQVVRSWLRNLAASPSKVSSRNLALLFTHPANFRKCKNFVDWPTWLSSMQIWDTKLSNLIVLSYIQKNLKAIIIIYYFNYSISKHQYSSQTSLLQIFLPEDSSLHLQSLSCQSKYPLLSKEINYSCHQSNNELARQDISSKHGYSVITVFNILLIIL